MKTEMVNDREILTQGRNALVQALGRGGFARFLQALTPKSGDFTEERRHLPEETLEEFVARIHSAESKRVN